MNMVSEFLFRHGLPSLLHNEKVCCVANILFHRGMKIPSLLVLAFAGETFCSLPPSQLVCAIILFIPSKSRFRQVCSIKFSIET